MDKSDYQKKGHIKKKTSRRPEVKLENTGNSQNREKARKLSFRSSPSPRKYCLSTGHRTFMSRSEIRGLAHHKTNVTQLQTLRSRKGQTPSPRTDREPGPGSRGLKTLCPK